MSMDERGVEGRAGLRGMDVRMGWTARGRRILNSSSIAKLTMSSPTNLTLCPVRNPLRPFAKG
eukprot:361276-Chlamydomonas_euryale.AAC.1